MIAGIYPEIFERAKVRCRPQWAWLMKPDESRPRRHAGCRAGAVIKGV